MSTEKNQIIQDLIEARAFISSVLNKLEDSVLIDDENPFGIVQEDSVEENLVIADQHLKAVLAVLEKETTPYL